MRWLSVFLVALLAFVPTTSFWPAPAEAQQRNAGGLTVPVTGDNNFVGSFTITRFAVQNGQAVAIGTLVGTVGGTAIGMTSIAMPIDTALSSGTCDILHLVLGPLDVDLLGLQIHLDQVVLDIVAQAGAGNLLGNLLCAIAGLLDPLGPLTQLVSLLNQLLGLLLG